MRHPPPLSHLSREVELEAQAKFIAQGRMTRISPAETFAACEREISKVRNTKPKENVRARY